MPRPRHFDLEELCAAWESGRFTTAPQVMEFLGIPDDYRRSVQATIRRFYGRRPRSAAKAMRNDAVKRAVINHLVDEFHLRRDYCSICQKYCGTDVYLRQLDHIGEKLGSVVVVGKCCKRAGDY